LTLARAINQQTMFPFMLLHNSCIMMNVLCMQFLQCQTIAIDNNMKVHNVQGIEAKSLPGQIQLKVFSVVKDHLEEGGGGEQHAGQER
jgi:hypothetical protein